MIEDNIPEHSIKCEMKKLFLLAMPVVLGQLAGLSMSVVDTIMSGRAGSVHMAAVAIASSLWVPMTIFGQGLLMAVTPFVAQTYTNATQETRDEEMAVFLRQGLWLTFFVATVIFFLLFALSFIIPYLGFEKELTDISQKYLYILIGGIFPYQFYVVCRAYLEGLGKTRPTMFIGFLALGVNIPLNYIFIFGKLGFPPLGGVGCAIASLICIICMATGMFFFTKRAYKKAFTYAPINMPVIKRILKVSFPNALALLIETSIFALIALFLAPFGQDTIAGHQVAMNAGSMLFMIPLGFSIAVAVRTGNALGANDRIAAKTVRTSAILIALIIGTINASIFLLFREQIAHIYTNDNIVFNLAITFMLFAAVYQIVDAIQVVMIGVLRGYNDTKALFGYCVISYWIISLPTSYILAFYGIPSILDPIGPYGFWVGLSIGLTCAFIFFCFRIAYLERQSDEVIIRKIWQQLK